MRVRIRAPHRSRPRARRGNSRKTRAKSPGNKIVRGAVLITLNPTERALAKPTTSFEEIVLPHLDAAYNLARWLAGNDRDAEDIAQEACLRAYRFFDGFRGGDPRAWLLAIVRRTAWTWLERNRRGSDAVEFDEAVHDGPDLRPDPSDLLARAGDIKSVREAIASLPESFREALVLRELEGLSYKQIAEITAAPVGTVMSRLARARALLQAALVNAPPHPEFP